MALLITTTVFVTPFAFDSTPSTMAPDAIQTAKVGVPPSSPSPNTNDNTITVPTNGPSQGAKEPTSAVNPLQGNTVTTSSLASASATMTSISINGQTTSTLPTKKGSSISSGGMLSSSEAGSVTKPSPTTPIPTFGDRVQTKKPTLVIILGIAGTIVIITIICTSLYIFHRRRRKSHKARDTQEARAYSYFVPPINNDHSALQHLPATIPSSSSYLSSSLWSRPVGSLMPKKLASEITLASSGSSGSTRRNAFHRHGEGPSQRGGRGVEMIELSEPPPPEYAI